MTQSKRRESTRRQPADRRRGPNRLSADHGHETTDRRYRSVEELLEDLRHDDADLVRSLLDD